jgi:Tol biopolymer transport system component
VALKLLRAEFSQDENRFRRFLQEARAISLLNHPNVITIYDVTEVDGKHIIATEYIEGQTLSQWMSQSRLTLPAAVDIVAQAAAGLVAAHAAGIVHRDIKPKNIMVRPDGVAKVLDFGVSKLTTIQAPVPLDGPTLDSFVPDKGAIMGTIAYMSPEQLRGQEVDGRADIFSLGVVLYELVAGQPPFLGPSVSDLIAAILTAEPAALVECEQIPAELCQILRKAMKKDPNERYPTCQDMLADLKSMQRKLEWKSEARLPNAFAEDRKKGKVMEGDDRGKNRRIGSLLTLAILVSVLAVAGYRLFDFLYRKAPTGPEYHMLSFTGKAGLSAAISPDGKYVAYVAENAGKQSIWLYQVATAVATEIVPPGEWGYAGIAFSQDNNYYIYYVQIDGKGHSTLYQRPMLADSPTEILQNVSGPIAWSADGQQFAFVRDSQQLMLCNADGRGEQTLATLQDDEIWLYPSWSPLGNAIACSVGSNQTAKGHIKIVNVRDKTSKIFATPPALKITWIAWLQDGSGLLASARSEDSILSRIWLLPYPEGEPQPITREVSSYYGLSVTRDSRSFVTVQNQRHSNLWVAPAGGTARATQITQVMYKDEGISGISWTPDNRIVYVSRMFGHRDIWIVAADGTNPKQLTMNARENSFPCVSPDGRLIAFVSDREGINNIWKMDIDGKNQIQLTRGGGRQPQWSGSGEWVIYEVSKGPAATLWKVAKDGGKPSPMVDADSELPAVSPDGKEVAFYQNFYNPRAPLKISVAPIAGGPLRTLIDTWLHGRIYRWHPSGLSLTYIDTRDGFSDIWNQPLNNEPPTRLTDLRQARIFMFDWSRDGKLACSCGDETFDIVLISNFKQ